MRHGWKPAQHDEPMLYLKHYIKRRRSLTVPGVIDWSGRAKNGFPMLGNDQYGDCVEAAVLHVDDVLGDDAYTPTTNDALSLYADVTGFNPNNPNSDQGTDIPTLLNWALKNPLPGSGTNILGWVSVDINDPVEMDLALWLGGNLLTGFLVPYSAEQQFSAGQVWDYIDPRSPIVGGHSTAIYGSGSFAPLEGSTWGSKYGMTSQFWHVYGQEMYLVFAEEWVVNGTAANNIDWKSLNADLASVFNVQPFVDPSSGGGESAVTVLGDIKTALSSWNGS